MSALERQGLFHQRRGWGSPGVQTGPPWPPGWGQGPPATQARSEERVQIGHFGCPRVRQQLSVGPLGTWFQPMLSSHCDYDLGPRWASVFPSMKWGQCRIMVTSGSVGPWVPSSCSGVGLLSLESQRAGDHWSSVSPPSFTSKTRKAETRGSPGWEAHRLWPGSRIGSRQPVLSINSL